MMRVTYVITKLDIGGAQETAIRSCVGLSRRGDDVVLVAGPEIGRNGESFSTARDLGLDVIVLESLVRRISPLRDVRAFLRLRRLFVEQRPDVVHTHSSKAGMVGRLAAKAARVPAVVHTVHGWSFRSTQPAPVRLAYVLLERIAAAAGDAVVVVSATDEAAGRAARIGTRSRYACIRSGIDLDAWREDGLGQVRARSALHVPEGRALIGTVSRLAPPKDTATLVGAVESMVLSGRDVHLAVVGEGPQREALERRTATGPLAGRVTFTGARRDVATLMHGFDVFVLSSLTEGLPRVVIEAMAARVPVVATNVGGVGEVVDDGVTGLLVPPADTASLATAISRLLDDPALRGRLTSAAATTAEAFSDRTMVDDLVRLYKELVS